MTLQAGDRVHARFLSNLASIGVFVLLLFATTWVFVPYLLTSARYPASGDVSGMLPIAVQRGPSPEIVRWADYVHDKLAFDGHLFVGQAGKTYTLNETDSFKMRPLANGGYELELDTDDYVFWSDYAIVEGKPVPTKFRFTGAFAAMYGLGVAIAGAYLFNWFLKRWLIRRNARKAVPEVTASA